MERNRFVTQLESELWTVFERLNWVSDFTVSDDGQEIRFALWKNIPEDSGRFNKFVSRVGRLAGISSEDAKNRIFVVRNQETGKDEVVITSKLD